MCERERGEERDVSVGEIGNIERGLCEREAKSKTLNDQEKMRKDWAWMSEEEKETEI